MKEAENAINYLEKALTIFEKNLGPDHPKTKLAQEALDNIRDSNE